MKKLALVAVILTAFVLMAQTFAPPGLLFGPPIATSVAQCVIPATHAAGLCPIESSAGVVNWYFWNGTAYQQSSGSQGPQGPQGPAGPQGPPGPVQSFTSLACTSSQVGTATNSSLAAAGCTEK